MFVFVDLIAYLIVVYECPNPLSYCFCIFVSWHTPLPDESLENNQSETIYPINNFVHSGIADIELDVMSLEGVVLDRGCVAVMGASLIQWLS